MKKATIEEFSKTKGTEPPGPSLEERLAPKLDQGEYLLVLVLALMLWIAGFVDLFTHTSQDREVLGLYSWPYFLFLILYSLGFVFWGALIFPAESLTWFKRGIHFFQTRIVAGLAWFGGAAALLLSMFVWERWSSFTLLQAALALLILLLSTVVLVARPFADEPIRRWRKGLMVFVGAVLAVEALLQLLTLARVLPLENYGGLFVKSGRVYQAQEGFTNTLMNQFGWYYPEFRLEEGSRRIVLTGDSLVQGLQVEKQELFGVLLDQKLNQDSTAGPIEVLGLGLPGYGPGLYLNLPLYPYTLEPLQPSEIVVFFHLANDFQTIDSPRQSIPYFIINDSGKVDVHEQDFALRHNLQHLIIRGYEPPNPVRTVASHLFVFAPVDSLLQRLTNGITRAEPPNLNFYQANSQQPLGAASFMFSSQPDPRADAAWEITFGLLSEFQQYTAERNVTMRLVTIPYFPAEFYTVNSGAGWDTRLGDFDLLLSERRLKEFAEQQSIPFLGLGEYMKSSGLSGEEVQTLFLKDGTGHFSPAGHAFVAQVLQECFYTSGAGCPGSAP